jgi:hypothetical protein
MITSLTCCRLDYPDPATFRFHSLMRDVTDYKSTSSDPSRPIYPTKHPTKALTVIRFGLLQFTEHYFDFLHQLSALRPRARTAETAFPEPYLLTETENKIIDDILEMLNKNSLTSYQSLNVLERLGRIIEMGQRVAKGTTH